MTTTLTTEQVEALRAFGFASTAKDTYFVSSFDEPSDTWFEIVLVLEDGFHVVVKDGDFEVADARFDTLTDALEFCTDEPWIGPVN